MIFSEAEIRVGASVTPSIGSTSTPSTGRAPRRRSSAAVGSPSGASPSASSSARGSSVRSEDGLARGACAPAAAPSSAARCRRSGASRRGRRRRRCHAEAEDALLGAADAVERWPSYGQPPPPPSLSRKSQRTWSGWCSAATSRPRSRRPPRRRRPRRAGRRARGASRSAPSAQAAATSAAVWDFMSSAPRPHRKPSARSPDHGSCVQAAGSASTVSTWESRHSVGPSAAAAQPGDEVGAVLGGAEQLALEAGGLQVRGEVLLRRALVARAG